MKLKIFSILIFLCPVLLFGQNAPKVRMYGDGNTSIKINDSANYLSNAEKRTWLENSALAFSENGEELYFRHPTDNYYQVWSVATKEKLSEITFNEAGNTPKGREITAAFPNLIYREDVNANSKIWLSADLSVSFDNRNKFKISGGQNQPDKFFTLKLGETIIDQSYNNLKKVLKKAAFVNTRYQLYFQKKSNKLFIIAYAVQKLKNGKDYLTFPYNGIFSFDMDSNTLNVLAENPDCSADHKLFIDKWYFFTNSLVHNYIDDGRCLFKRFNLANITQQDLEYATTNRGRAGVDLNAWKNTFVGTDLQDNLYLADPTNQHVKIFYFDKAIDSKGTLVTILNSTNKLNEVIYEKDYWVFTEGLAYKVIENVLAVSPSGKYFAYLNLNNRSDVGNYASIMLYNLNESDRVYTLNDQTKFKPYITKGFVTDKESEDLAKVWDKKTEEKKKQEEANADLKKKQEDAAKLERQAQYKPQLDALKLKITNAEAEFAAYKKPATDIYEAGNYQAVLENNHNQWYYSEHPFEIKDYSFTIKVKFERRGKDDVYAYVEESLQFPKSYIIDGKLAIVPDDEYNVVDNYKNYQYEGVKYVSSKYEGYIIETKGKGLSFQILGGQFQKGIEVLDRGEKFKKMGDRFLGFLDKAKLSVNINPSKNFWIGIESKTGYQIIIVAPEATEGMKLRQKVYELEQELEKLKAKIESGN